MKTLRQLLAAISLILLVSCDPFEPSSSGPRPPPIPHLRVNTNSESARTLVYEALIRHLADPKGQPIYVRTNLCVRLIQGDPGCPDQLDPEEVRVLGQQLQDLGDIVFWSRNDSGMQPEVQSRSQLILLGQIVEKHQGLRVEGGYICGGLCGHGAVYIVVATADGYEVTGTDGAYGWWAA